MDLGSLLAAANDDYVVRVSLFLLASYTILLIPTHSIRTVRDPKSLQLADLT